MKDGKLIGVLAFKQYEDKRIHEGENLEKKTKDIKELSMEIFRENAFKAEVKTVSEKS